TLLTLAITVPVMGANVSGVTPDCPGLSVFAEALPANHAIAHSAPDSKKAFIFITISPFTGKTSEARSFSPMFGTPTKAQKPSRHRFSAGQYRKRKATYAEPAFRQQLAVQVQLDVLPSPRPL